MTISPVSRNGLPRALAEATNERTAQEYSRCRHRAAGPRVEPGGLRFRRRQCRLGQNPRAGQPRHPAAAQRCEAGEDPLHHVHQGSSSQHGPARVCDTRPMGTDARRRTRRRHPRSRRTEAEFRDPHAGAKAVRRRAGDPGRAQGANHSRPVHTAAAAISVRGQRACAFLCAG